MSIWLGCMLVFRTAAQAQPGDHSFHCCRRTQLRQGAEHQQGTRGGSSADYRPQEAQAKLIVLDSLVEVKQGRHDRGPAQLTWAGYWRSKDTYMDQNIKAHTAGTLSAGVGNEIPDQRVLYLPAWKLPCLVPLA